MVVSAVMCVWPWYTDEPLPLGVCVLIFTVGISRPQMAVEGSWSFQRSPRLAAPPPTTAAPVPAAPNKNDGLISFFAFGGRPEAVKADICSF